MNLPRRSCGARKRPGGRANRQVHADSQPSRHRTARRVYHRGGWEGKENPARRDRAGAGRVAHPNLALVRGSRRGDRLGHPARGGGLSSAAGFPRPGGRFSCALPPGSCPCPRPPLVGIDSNRSTAAAGRGRCHPRPAFSCAHRRGAAAPAAVVRPSYNFDRPARCGATLRGRPGRVIPGRLFSCASHRRGGAAAFVNYASMLRSLRGLSTAAAGFLMPGGRFPAHRSFALAIAFFPIRPMFACPCEAAWEVSSEAPPGGPEGTRPAVSSRAPAARQKRFTHPARRSGRSLPPARPWPGRGR
jgi:hypothetical protein